MARREPYRGTVRATEFEVVAGPGSPLLQAGNALRARVIDAIQPVEPARALLAGFLVGDTGGLDELDIEAMRRAGLSHFTAVSGSNVALFLGLLFLASGPLSFGPKRQSSCGAGRTSHLRSGDRFRALGDARQRHGRSGARRAAVRRGAGSMATPGFGSDRPSCVRPRGWPLLSGSSCRWQRPRGSSSVHGGQSSREECDEPSQLPSGPRQPLPRCWSHPSAECLSYRLRST